MLEKLIKQSIPFYHYLLLILFFIGFYSCEYDCNDFNYVQKEKPKDQIQLGIDLAGVNPHDIIHLYNNSVFSYSLFTDGKDVFVRQFYLDGLPIETNQETGEGYLITNIKDSDIHELKLIIALRTGTGSLAEYAHYEMYTGEFNFKIKIIPPYDKLNIRETTDSNNNLRLEWDKPLGYEITGYSIYKDNENGELIARIDNPNETYFVDTDYAYGHKYYMILTEIKNSFNIGVRHYYSVHNADMTEKDFETTRISANEISIKWINPYLYPCKYVLTYGNNNERIIIENGINEAVIPTKDFPTISDSFSLYILPVTADADRFDFYYKVYGSHSDSNFSAISFDGNVTNSMLHALNFNSLNNYDLSTMEEKTPVNHLLNIDTGCKIQVSNNGQIAIVDSYGFLHIYSDYSLKNQINQFKAEHYPFEFIADNKILIEQINGFKLYDINTKNIIASKSWEPEFSGGYIYTKTTVSSEAKYIYVLCSETYSTNPKKEWVELYELAKDNSLKLLEKDIAKNIQSIHFHPTSESKAIIQYSRDIENKFVIIDILTKDKKEIKGEFMHIDPFTGNLLLRGEEYRKHEYNVYVLDKNYSKEIIKIKLANNNPWAISTLYNNTLFFNGYYVDLSNFKEWKQ